MIDARKYAVWSVQMEWWVAVTVVAIPSQPALLLMWQCVSAARSSVLSPRASRAILHSWHPADCILPILVRKLAVGTATRKRVQNKWSSTGETADAADSALQTVDLCFNWNNKCLTWFLDQDIPSHPEGVNSRILEESLLWEEHLDKIRIRTTEGLTTCMVPHWGWPITSNSWNFSQSQWLDWQQELITGIQEETKCTEEKEETGHRSPRW